MVNKEELKSFLRELRSEACMHAAQPEGYSKKSWVKKRGITTRLQNF